MGFHLARGAGDLGSILSAAVLPQAVSAIIRRRRISAGNPRPSSRHATFAQDLGPIHDCDSIVRVASTIILRRRIRPRTPGPSFRQPFQRHFRLQVLTYTARLILTWQWNQPRMILRQDLRPPDTAGTKSTTRLGEPLPCILLLPLKYSG